MSRQDDIKQLIVTHNRHLQKLKEQKALFGAETSPKTLLEIENVEAEIEQLQAELKEQEGIVEMASETNLSDTKPRPQKTEPVKSTIWGLPQIWWVPIVGALIGLIGVIIPLVINNEASTSQPFTYCSFR